MEIDNLGARCMLADCRVLDYLPIRCGACGGSFCTEHQSPAAHACLAQPIERSARLCPRCGLDVGPTPGALKRHLATCKGRVRTDPVCAHKGCNVRDALNVVCPLCRKRYCLQHRHPEEHACPALPQGNAGGRRPKPKPAATPAPAPAKRPASARAGSAPRVDFANAPTAPLGGARIPLDERLPVRVYLPAGSGLPAQHMVFSERFSAGKVIDDIARLVPALPKPATGTRYHLYAVRAGGGGVNLLPHITPLRDLPAGTLTPADALVLEASDAGLPPEWHAALAKASVSAVTSSLWKQRMGRASRTGNGEKKSRCTMS